MVEVQLSRAWHLTSTADLTLAAKVILICVCAICDRQRFVPEANKVEHLEALWKKSCGYIVGLHLLRTSQRL